ncbi:DUF6371 domain-containing protein [Spirosoma radiotolerans]|uniref:Uncharacterized protein n=1 Tax=Spirosoma radiotolerans TaxID=1379870 RepID=A0A0E3ZRG9_9BACT|nr:DUF6371 domain-containing protein [Spirosoma radiotolerans]AKD53789.1 hypothetical protein SD10_01605 [Spirosoma radiotolerans]
MNQYRYTLQPYKGMSTRYTCPACEKPKQLSRYLDKETGELLPDHVGRCNREADCGYHYTPRQYFEDNKIWMNDEIASKTRTAYQSPKSARPVPQPSYIPFNLFRQSLNQYDRNEFANGLQGLFNNEITNDLISRFYIGTSKHWPGATVFWQIDKSGQIRTGKIMLYNPLTLKRVKQPFSHIHWVHSVLTKQGRFAEFELSQCLFGLHQLKNQPDSRPVAIVESEKTAILATVYLPKYIWLACGSLSNLSTEKLLPVAGRSVTLFPDLNGFEKWSQKAEEFRPVIGRRLTVSDVLEKRANDADREKGYDLADYLIRNRDPLAGWALTDSGYPLFWDYNPLAVPAQSLSTSAVCNNSDQNITPLPLTLLEQTLQRMNQRNPVLQDLINQFDLVNPKTGQPFRLSNQ